MNTPLTTSLLQQLRERQSELPEAQRNVVRVVLDDPRAAVVATVEQLSQQAGVSMPTIVRTCRSFGHDSVRELMVTLSNGSGLDAPLEVSGGLATGWFFKVQVADPAELAGLLDAVTMIGVGIALFFTFANPFVGQLAG